MSDFTENEIKGLLPEKYSLDSSGNVRYQESESNPSEKVSNYLPKLLFWKQIKISRKEQINSITFSLIIEGEEAPDTWMAELSSFSRMDFTATCNSRCYNYLSGNKSNRLLSQIVHYQLRKLTRQEIPYFNRLGWTTLDGDKVYVAGKEVITKDGISNKEYSFDEELSDFKLEIDEQMERQTAAEYWFSLMGIKPMVTDILVANTIVGLSRSLFVEAQIPPKYVIYIVVDPHYGKTTYAALTSSIFNRADNIEFSLISFTSSNASIQKEISRFRDCPLVIDDLYSEHSIAAMRQRERNACDIIRSVGNNEAPKKQLGKKTIGYSPNGTIVMTAEYLLTHSFSSLTRCVILHLDQQLEPAKVSRFQQCPLALPTAAYHYLQWCATNYSKNVELIRTEYREFRERNKHNALGLERIEESAFVLEMGIRLLCDFAIDVGILSEKGKANTMHNISISFSFIIRQQLIDLENTASIKGGNDITYLIGSLFIQRRFSVADSVSDYRRDIHDGVFKEGLICLDSKRLVRIVRDCQHDLTINQERIGHDLRSHGLLALDKSGASTKKTKEVRMFHIRRRELMDFLATSTKCGEENL